MFANLFRPEAFELSLDEKIACAEPVELAYGEDYEEIPQDDINTVTFNM